jgi:hypothetical protein
VFFLGNEPCVLDWVMCFYCTSVELVLESGRVLCYNLSLH